MTAAFRRLRARFVNGIPKFSDPYNMVESYSWKPKTGRLNFGDHLADVIVDRVLAQHGTSRFEETARSTCLFSVGSVLHFARDGDTVWGSGINGKVAAKEHNFHTLDVRAVRGPLTADWLRRRGIAVPDVYGDPALLLPTLFPNRFVKSGAQKPIFVPNLNDLVHSSPTCPIKMVSPLRGWNFVVAQIMSSELVLASSLHGLIVAEAYGIPARYVRLSDHENLFKYDDYMMGSGRSRIEYATSIEEGLEMGGMDPAKFDPTPLLTSFPIDLWDQPEQ